jgi:hypothetical protein
MGQEIEITDEFILTRIAKGYWILIHEAFYN